MRTSAIFLIISLLLIGAVATEAQAKNTKVIRVSVTIPAIVGLNVPEETVSSSSEDKILNRDIIIQVEERKEGKKKAVLKTILLK